MEKTLYTGKALLTKDLANEFKIDPYLPSGSLVKAVQLAQILNRPLLVKGEPGCGKSRLAEAIAAELFGKNFNDYYIQWNVKSTSKAQDGLYTINNLQRLSDANIKKVAGSDGTGSNLKKNADPSEEDDLKIKLFKDDDGSYKTKGKYIELGELGKAFMLTYKDIKHPPVVLIDEIDKADIDFPNDLLLELDKMQFSIPEIRDHESNPIIIKVNPADDRKDFKPLFIITSNDEKPLPAAFLRRCLFYYIGFEEIQLGRIVSSKYPELEQKIVDDAVEKFTAWRKKIEEMGTGNKNISTSELLDWIKIIDHYLNEGDDQNSKLIVEKDTPNHASALLKDVESIKLFTSKKETPGG